jgi:hypothetical protein
VRVFRADSRGTQGDRQAFRIRQYFRGSGNQGRPQDIFELADLSTVYVDGELIGGCDIIVEMYHSGELQKLLSESAAANGELQKLLSESAAANDED